MCQTLMSLVICRLDDKNGSVNRAAASLPISCMHTILDQEMFSRINGPKSERALLRLAVDWCSKPWRAKDEILEVMRKVRLAGVPARTLLHLDEGSGKYAGKTSNHTLKDQLRDLCRRAPPIADETGSIADLLIEALENQRKERRDEGLVRPCFEAPDYPDNSELYNLGMEYSLQSFWKRRSEKRLEEYEKKLEKAEESLAEHKAALEEAKREIAILKGEQPPAQDEQKEEAGEKRPIDAAPAAETAKRPKPDA